MPDESTRESGSVSRQAQCHRTQTADPQLRRELQRPAGLLPTAECSRFGQLAARSGGFLRLDRFLRTAREMRIPRAVPSAPATTSSVKTTASILD